MKALKYLPFILFLFMCSLAGAQKQLMPSKEDRYLMRRLTIEPGVGIHTNFGTDLLITNLVQWNPFKRLSLAAHTSFNINNVFQRDFNYVKTNYNYSFNQKFGAGTTLYSRKSSHS